MSTGQRLILSIGVALMSLACLFPAWTYTLNDIAFSFEASAGRHFILSPPPPRSLPTGDADMGATSLTDPRIDAVCLLADVFIITAAMAALFFFFRRQPPAGHRAGAGFLSKAR